MSERHVYIKIYMYICTYRRRIDTVDMYVCIYKCKFIKYKFGLLCSYALQVYIYLFLQIYIHTYAYVCRHICAQKIAYLPCERLAGNGCMSVNDDESPVPTLWHNESPYLMINQTHTYMQICRYVSLCHVRRSVYLNATIKESAQFQRRCGWQ